MSPIEYANLTLEERAELVFNEGAYVATADNYYGHKVVLYSLYTFWVEVHYSSIENKIENVLPAGPDDLRKYLSQIDIDTF